MFTRKIKSVFDKLIRVKQRSRYLNKVTNKYYEVGEKVIYRMYQNNKIHWEMGIIEKKDKKIWFTWWKDRNMCIKGIQTR